MLAVYPGMCLCVSMRSHVCVCVRMRVCVRERERLGCVPDARLAVYPGMCVCHSHVRVCVCVRVREKGLCVCVRVREKGLCWQPDARRYVGCSPRYVFLCEHASAHVRVPVCVSV